MFPALLSRKWRDEPQSHIFRDTYSNSIVLIMVKETLCLVHISLECMQMVKQVVFEAMPKGLQVRVLSFQPILKTLTAIIILLIIGIVEDKLVSVLPVSSL